MNKQITNKGTKIFFNKTGSGKKILITFHGYGQSLESFSSFNNVFLDYTIYHLELFFHNNSYLSDNDRPLKQDKWIEIFSHFLESENIKSFSLAGFSMGCRFILPLIRIIPQKINHIYLIAPDGIARNIYYNVGVRYLNHLFKYTIFKPKWFFKLLQLFYYSGLIDRSLMIFVKNQMNNLKKRWRVYQSWMNFRYLDVKLDEILKIINQNGIGVTISLGKKDKVIPSGQIKRLTKKIKEKDLLLLDANHWDIIEKTSQILFVKFASEEDSKYLKHHE